MNDRNEQTSEATQQTTGNETPNSSKTSEEKETTTEAGEAAKWYLNQDIQGKGNKPEWFNNKTFKTITDQAKAYPELRKKLANFQGSPEQYNYDLGDNFKDIKINEQDPDFVIFDELAKKSGMSQELYTNILKLYFERDKKISNQLEKNYKDKIYEDYKKIGENPKQQLDILENWWSNMFPDNDIKEFKNCVKNSTDYFHWNKIREKMNSTRIPSNIAQSGTPRILKSELRKMLVSDDYKKNPEIQKEVNEAYTYYYPAKS